MSQPTARSGPIALRPLGLAEILDGSVRVLRRNLPTMLVISALVAVGYVALIAALQLSAFRNLDQVQLELVTTGLVGGFAGELLTGLLSIPIAQDVLGVRLGPAAIWRAARGRMWALLALAFVLTVAQDVTLFIVLGIWLWGLWAVAAPALMVERTSLRRAFSRSAYLVSGSWWRVWGIRALGVVLTSVLGLLVTVPFLLLALYASGRSFSAGAAGAGPTYVLITSVGSVIAATVTWPIRAGIDVLLYLDLRMRKEGLDIVLTYGEPVAAPAGSWA
ncbi:MAG: hypothetical protein ACR2LF_11635 [Jatrophihabitantaceae bacterium]